jgi:mannose-6-phosphate isomerase-like protein (cupin superfamily)
MPPSLRPGFEIVDFAQLDPQPCPCGFARRAFQANLDFPGTVHLTEITHDAKTHYHRRLTETYYILECDPDARLQLDDQLVPIVPGMAILIRPGTRHRAIGRMKILNIVFPKFDPSDEWFD